MRYVLCSILGFVFVVVTSCQSPTVSTATNKILNVSVVYDAQNCPDHVSTAASNCPAGIGSDGTVCVQPGDKVVWSGTPAGKDFKVKFAHSPCQSGRNPKECRIKDRESSGIVKYDLEAQGCTTVDPYIIVMR